MNDSHGSRYGEAETRGELKAQFAREELVERLGRAIPEDGLTEPMPGLYLNRLSSIGAPIYGVTYPALCLIAQGVKEIHLGDERYRYDAYHYLLATFELPIASVLLEASPERPYLSLRLRLDPALVASVMLEAGMLSPHKESAGMRAIDVSPLNSNLLDAVVRLARLLEASPAEARVLWPLVTREIVLRLLQGEQGIRVSQLAMLGGHTDRIARALERLRTGFDQPLRIESLAREVGMSPSVFHDQFKTVTAMSPLQFQKHLRLQEARRLMLGENLDAASAGYKVGYEDPSHFSRDYKRHFGQSPMKDIERLRHEAASVLA